VPQFSGCPHAVVTPHSTWRLAQVWPQNGGHVVVTPLQTIVLASGTEQGCEHVRTCPLGQSSSQPVSACWTWSEDAVLPACSPGTTDRSSSTAHPAFNATMAAAIKSNHLEQAVMATSPVDAS